MRKKAQILVVGYSKELCDDNAYENAYSVGKEVAKSQAVLITGGLGGVMEAASKGAAEEGGLVVGIIPQDDPKAANPYCDIVIPSGMGIMRDFLTAFSCDAMIIVGGGAGSMIEACASYLKGKPILSIKGTGGTADELAGKYLDQRKTTKILGVNSPSEAVSTAIKLI
ncbi:MAG: TIGR00725 family protein, partial [Nitrososphaerales archaeon]